MDDLDKAHDALHAVSLQWNTPVELPPDTLISLAKVHIQLWYAKQHCFYQEAVAERNRVAAEQLKAAPPPCPPFPTVFPQF